MRAIGDVKRPGEGTGRAARSATRDGIWGAVHAERRALAADLSGLSTSAWDTQSLCDQWSVLQVLAHLVATARMSPPHFFAGLAGARFNHERFTERQAARESAKGPEAVLRDFRAVETLTSAPPGPAIGSLGETLVHAEDIRRPLGLAHTYPVENVIPALEFSAASRLVGGRRRVAGLTLEATDAGWFFGSGPVVSGPGMSLLLVVTGRRSALEDLVGPGLPILRQRMLPE